MGHRHFTAALCKSSLLWCTHTSLSTVGIMLCVCWPQRQAAVNLFQALWNLQYPDSKNKRDLENNEKWKGKQKGFYSVSWLCFAGIIANVLSTVWCLCLYLWEAFPNTWNSMKEQTWVFREHCELIADGTQHMHAEYEFVDLRKHVEGQASLWRSKDWERV